jgi:flagellar basal-body rod protein FlgC
MSNDGMFTIFRISQRGLGKQMKKLKVTAENIANADKTAGPDGKIYNRKVVAEKLIDEDGPSQFGSQLNLQMKRSGSRHLTHSDNNRVYQAEQDKDNLEVMEIDEPKLVYNPGHPLADENGYVRVSNVNMVEEMVNMMSASRAYDANLSAIDAAKNMAEKAMKI